MSPVLRRGGIDELALLLEGGSAGTGQTAGLAALAGRLRTLGSAPAPNAEFRTALRQRLVAVATVQAAQAATADAVVAPATAPARTASWTQGRTAQRRIGLAAGAMASVVVVSGVTVASLHSLPGQPFYAAKRAGEAVQLDLARGDAAKGAKQLDFAATRLREVTALAHGDSELSLGAPGGGALAGGSRSSEVAQALRDMDRETRAGRDLLVQAYRDHRDTGALQVLVHFTTRQQAGLTAVRSDLPAGVQQQVSTSLDLVTSIGADTSALLSLGSCTSQCDPSGAGPAPTSTPPGATPAPPGNGVPPCTCIVPSPEPTPSYGDGRQPTAPSSPSTTAPASPAPAPSATPAPSPAPSPSPTPPVVVPTLPVPSLPSLPTIPPLPIVLPTALPTFP